MSKILLQQLRKQRELKIQLTNKLSVTARRPTQLQFEEIREKGRYADLGKRYIIGWDGFTENDIVGGGGTDKVPFDEELWGDWFEDHSEHWMKIATSVIDAYNAYNKSTEEAAKNSQPG